MARTVTLRLDDETYDYFRGWAEADNRPLSNLIETAAKRHLEAALEVEPEEMAAIRADRALVRRLRAGSRDAKRGRGRLVG